MNMRAALYARVSTDEQANEGHSIEGQLEAMHRHAESRGWEVVAEYVDAGFSARTDKRPEFKRMIADARAGKFDVILVLRFDRFSRNRKHAIMYKELLREQGVTVVSVTEPLEAGSPSSFLLEGMGEVLAEWYSIDLSVKITAAKWRRAQQGLWNGDLPFGYTKGPDGNAVVVPDEAAVVTKVYEQYASGRRTCQQIATWLNGTEFRPRAKRRDRRGREYLWSKDTVRDMLRNPFYVGYATYKGKPLPGRHEAIVGQDLFDRAQQARRQHYQGPWTYTPRHRTYLLGGLARCASCGTKLWPQHLSG